MLPFGLPADAALPGSEAHSFPQGQRWLFGTEEGKQGADGAALQPVPEALPAHLIGEQEQLLGCAVFCRPSAWTSVGVRTTHGRLLAQKLNFLVTTVSFPTTKLFQIMTKILQNSLQTEAHSSWSHTFFFSVSNSLFSMFGLDSEA